MGHFLEKYFGRGSVIVLTKWNFDNSKQNVIQTKNCSMVPLKCTEFSYCFARFLKCAECRRSLDDNKYS